MLYIIYYKLYIILIIYYHYFDNNKLDVNENQIFELEKVRKKYGNASAFQTCFLLFNKYLIEQNYFEKLYNDYLVNYCYHELARTKWWDQTIFNAIFYKKWESLGEEYINRNPVMDNIHWKVEELENGYYDDTDYSDTIALHFFHFFQPWNKNNLRFYPKWEEYLYKRFPEGSDVWKDYE